MPDSSKRLGLGVRTVLEYLSIVLAFLIFLLPASAQEPPTEKNVLMFESFSAPSLGTVELVKSALRAGSPWPVNVYVEYLEGQRFDDEDYVKGAFESLQHTYAGQKLDLMMAESYPALQFVLKYRDELFPGVPVVFWGVVANRIAGERQMWSGVTGVTDNLDARGTINLALRLHPDTNTVAVITNNSEFERYWLSVVHAELLRHQDKVSEVDLVALPTAQLLERVAALPPQTIVLFQEGPQASIQPVMGPYDILAWVGHRLPTYCIFPVTCLDHGGIGGVDSDWEKTQIPLVAKIARRVLSGDRPDEIPVVNGWGYKVRVDWRQLRRWKILESALPPGSVIMYREATFWERYRYYIIAAGAVILIQSLLIIGLLQQRVRKRRAEAVLRESERRFRVMADTTPALVWMCDEEGKITYQNSRRLAFMGPLPDDGYGHTWHNCVHADDVQDVQDVISLALNSHQPFSMEYRLRRQDGFYRWMFDVASPRKDGDGSFVGFIGSAVDITDQKLAQEALKSVSGRLIEAQEKERRRIARELHDDVCQRLALLSNELDLTTRSLNGSAPAAKLRLQQCWKHCFEIARDLQSLSHELHSSKLDYMGAAFAIKSLCHEITQQHKVSIEFQENGLPAQLPKDVSLCLFRVAQEALHNAVKYSGIRQFSVEMSRIEDDVQLVVQDAGVGFDLEEVKRDRGLGLVSMQERVHLVHGRFHAESRPGAGTKIVAAVPVNLHAPTA